MIVAGASSLLEMIVQWRETALRADVVDVALRQHCTHPGQKRAAAVKVTEDRAAAAVANFHPVHLGPNRIRQFAAAHLVARNRARGRVKSGPKAVDEVLPRRGFSRLARDCEAQVLGVNCVDERFDAAALERTG